MSLIFGRGNLVRPHEIYYLVAQTKKEDILWFYHVDSWMDVFLIFHASYPREKQLYYTNH